MKESSAKPQKLDPVVERGLQYDRGELKTSPLVHSFRASYERDLTCVAALSSTEQLRYVEIALRSLSRGEGIYGALAAGASSRMNPQDAGFFQAEIDRLLTQLYGEPQTLASKAAVPLGRGSDGRVYTFLGLFLKNVSRLEKWVGNWAVDPKPNSVLILTSDAYAQELEQELRRQHSYDYAGEILKPRQALGEAYYATESDAKKVRGKAPEWVDEAVKKSRAVRRQIATGHPEAIVIAGEKSPLGHGEFFHQLVSSGLLLGFLESKTRWISVRNIDNLAATFDWEWLVTLGVFLNEDLDFQAEVSPRSPGQKGGALVITDEQKHLLAEAPSFEATWQASVESFKAQGFEPVTRAQALRAGKARWAVENRLLLNPHQMDFEGSSIHTWSDVEQGLDPRDQDGKQIDQTLYLFKHADGAEKWIRRVHPEDTYWFNDAVGLFSPQFLYLIYRKDKAQSLSEFIQELKQAAADPLEREAIAHRGRSKFPVLVDPKPSRQAEPAVAAKIETNLWQATGVAEDARVRAIGVASLFNIEPQRFTDLEPAERRRAVGELRMLATKHWTGSAESYESNQRFVQEIIDYVVDGDLLKGHAPPPRPSRPPPSG